MSGRSAPAAPTFPPDRFSPRPEVTGLATIRDQLRSKFSYDLKIALASNGHKASSLDPATIHFSGGLGYDRNSATNQKFNRASN